MGAHLALEVMLGMTASMPPSTRYKNLFREKDPTVFHCARHKELYDEVKGGMMYCPDCKQTVSNIDIVNKALHYKDGKTV